MKTNQIQHYLRMLLAVASIVAMSSCDKDDDITDPAPRPEPVQWEFRVKKVDTPFREDMFFYYDAEGKLTGSDNVNHLHPELEPGRLYFEYDDQRRMTKARDEHGNNVEFTYQGKRLAETKHFVATMLRAVQTYAYNGKGQIVEASYKDVTDNNIARKTTYQYDAKGNVTVAKKYRIIGNVLTLEIIETYSDFDNSQNVNSWYFLPGTVDMVNNPGKLVTQYVVRGQESSSTTLYQYQYDDAKRPVKLEYLHNNQSLGTFTYEYEPNR